MSTLTFLSLPGEIRNRIYEYCVEPKPRQLLRMPKRPRKHYRNTRYGLYGSLRNVCKQTRAEFGPMYMAETVHAVHQVTANTFLYSLYPELRQQNELASEQLQSGCRTDKHHASTSASGLQGNIQIITYFGHEYDATPLIHLCAKNPAFKVSFTDASACLRLGCLVNDFFATISSGAFRPHMKRIQRIAITCSTQPEITLFLPCSVADDLMAHVGDPRQAMNEMGAPPMDAFAVVFRDGTGRLYERSEPRA